MNSALFIQLFRTLGPLVVLLSLFSCNPKVEEGDTVVIESVSPTSGALAGGTTVTITGSGFKYVTGVSFGTAECSDIVFLSFTKLTCTTPAHAAGSVDITLHAQANKSDVLSSSYLFQSGPVIDSVTPSSGFSAGGTSVIIAGSGFIEGAVPRFGGALCTNINFIDSETIQCTTPARGAGVRDVQVTNPDSQTSNIDSFTFVAAPLIYSVSPSGGPLAGGNLVTITGSGFEAGTTISFGAAPCPVQTLTGSSVLTCTVPGPAAAGAVSVTALNPDTQTSVLQNGYTYRNAPTVSTVSIDSGSINGGTVIWVGGANFASGAVASLDGTNCASTFYNSPTSLICVTAAHAAGLVDLVVTNADTQAGTLGNAFTYRPAPTVTSASPNSGPLTGGTAITITGTGFVALPTPATVTVGGVSCTGVVVVNPTTITCTTGVNTEGAKTINVHNYDGQYGATSSVFTYLPPPTVTNVAAASGPTAGGTTVTITGTGFLATPDVDFDGVDCTNIVVNSGTSITCDTPAHAAGAVAVTVTNTDLQSGSMPAAFTYIPPPTVSTVSPNVGTIAGGTNVTVTGTGFLNGATVDFGGSSCSSVSVTNDTTITCTTTAHASGAVTVTVTNMDTQDGSAAAYTYQTPAALAVNPDPLMSPAPIPDPVVGVPHVWGSFAANVTYVYTIENTGEMSTPALSVALSNSTNWTITADTCSGSIIVGGGTCTVDVRFNVGTNDDGAYATTLEVTGAGIGTLELDIEGTDTTSND